MKGSLETLELLMCLHPKRFYNSSIIRESLEKSNLNTLNSRLDRLTKRGLIDKRNISEKLKPGGDKIKYKLTKEGNKLKEELKEKAKNIIFMDSSIKKALLKQTVLEDDNIITNILDEYSQELEVHFEGKDLSMMTKKLRAIISKNVTII
jgi:DNA-binding HxlR family transcriptional regulator